MIRNPPAIHVSQAALTRAAAVVPSDDFIQPAYDADAVYPLRGIFILLSTPRSGSTLFCDLATHAQLCCPTEYFQPYEYLPHLAQRWNACNDGKIDFKAFAAALVRQRTYSSGWLGLKLHPSHIPYFERARAHLPNVEIATAQLTRRDQLAQAVSLSIAKQTKKWSSKFEAQQEARYDYQLIDDCLKETSKGNEQILCYARANGWTPATVTYEDLAEDPRNTFSSLPGLGSCSVSFKDATLEKQTSSRNEDWARRFAQERMSRESKSFDHRVLLRRILGRPPAG